MKAATWSRKPPPTFKIMEIAQNCINIGVPIPIFNIFSIDRI
jgi:hypothetical protein